ncbi:response regulator [bacterium 1XD8-76]|nr:response regulator [bacterium 1XD8-76]
MMNELSVMIVDDEKLAREDMQTFIDWESLGFHIVATAVNGRQALKMYEKHHPKIVFTDIKMPVMDGIEFSKALRKIDEQVIIILLTAYEEFSYAKAAITLGVTDYVIKNEITPQSMEILLGKLRQRIETVQRSSNILNDKLIENYFQAQEDNVGILEGRMLEKRLCYLMVEQNLPLNISEEPADADFCVRKQEISEALRGVDYVSMKMKAVSNVWENVTAVILDTELISQNDNYQILYKNAVRVREFLEERFERDFTVFYTMEPLTLPNWKKLCKNNERIFRQRCFKPEEAIVGIVRKPESQSRRADFDKKQLQQLMGGSEEKLEEYIGKIYDDICEAEDYQEFCSLSKKLYACLLEELQKQGEVSDRQELSFKKNWKDWMDAEKIRDWMIRQFKMRMEKSSGGEERRNSRIIAAVKAYIRQNYANPDLTLDEIAEYVHLNTSYLCTAFKQETGNTIKNYITDIRIEAAKKQLDEGNGKIYEVGLSVGYQSGQYFSQVFYRKVGVSPGDYRRYGG